jgi:molecular chaperone GrpE
MTENATDATNETQKTENQNAENQNTQNQNTVTQKYNDVIPEPQPGQKTETQPEAKAEARPETKPDTKPETKPDTKPEPRPDSRETPRTTGAAGAAKGGEVPDIAGGATSTAVAETLSGLREENERLRVERDGLIDRLARLQAEFDNARKREQRERADYRAFAVADAVEQFLPVLDNFRLALNAKGTAEQLRTGVELIAKQMDEVLRTLNVTPVETVGQPFDPRVHEALESVERTDLPDHQVIDEVRRGYRIKERLLRPALVRISVNPNLSEA